MIIVLLRLLYYDIMIITLITFVVFIFYLFLLFDLCSHVFICNVCASDFFILLNIINIIPSLRKRLLVCKI